MDTWCSPPPPYREPLTRLYSPIKEHSNENKSINEPDISLKSSLIYRDSAPTTSGRINRFYGLVSQHLDSIYLFPHHSSNFSRVNYFKSRRVKNPPLLSSYLEREVVNSLSLVHQSNDILLFAKPTGVFNSGVSLFSLYKGNNLADHVRFGESEFDGLEGFHTVSSFSNGEIWSCAHLAKIYSRELSVNVNTEDKFRDYDILEMKADNKNVSKSLVYLRNFYGFSAISVDLGSFCPKVIKAKKYTDDVIYNMAISKFESGTVALLSKNAILIENIPTGQSVKFANYKKKLNSEVQTIAYGSSPNVMLMGGNKLYVQDMRTDKVNQGIVDNNIKAHITSNSQWTFRRVKTKSLHKEKRHFSPDTCAYNKYYSNIASVFWDAITAISPHPVHANLVAFVFGVSNCIYIFDLNMPTTPLYELPISDASYIGSRCRHLEWVEATGYYKWLLIPFNWRDKILSVFYFDANLSLSSPKHIIFEPKLDIVEESNRFPNYAGVFEEYTDITQPVISSESNLLNSIFHGYSGVVCGTLDNKLHIFLNSTTGRLMDIAEEGAVLDKHVERDRPIMEHINKVESKNKTISIPDDEFLDGLCNLKVKNLIKYKSRVDIPDKYKFDSLFTDSDLTMGLTEQGIDDYSGDRYRSIYNDIREVDGYKSFYLDNVKYLCNYSWNRLERAERLDQKYPYAELFKSYMYNMTQCNYNFNSDRLKFDDEFQGYDNNVIQYISKASGSKPSDLVLASNC